MTAITLSGVHHVLVPVSDITASRAWWGRVMNAERLDDLDHLGDAGDLVAVIMKLPGTGPMLQLRRDAELARKIRGFGPVTYAVPDRAVLDAWLGHLDDLGVEHSTVRKAMIGDTFELQTPEGLVVRFYTDPA